MVELSPTFTMTDLFVAFILVTFDEAGLLLLFLFARRDQNFCGYRTLCKDNLSTLAIGLKEYVDHSRGGKYYSWPSVPFGGDDRRASLFWVGLIADPELYMCPNPQDDTWDGFRLGTSFEQLPVGVISYAGPGRSEGASKPGAAKITPGAIPDDFPVSAPLAADDWDTLHRHSGGGNATFFDRHVEWIPMPKVTTRPGIGKLDCLKNQAGSSKSWLLWSLVLPPLAA